MNDSGLEKSILLKLNQLDGSTDTIIKQFYKLKVDREAALAKISFWHKMCMVGWIVAVLLILIVIFLLIYI